MNNNSWNQEEEPEKVWNCHAGYSHEVGCPHCSDLPWLGLGSRTASPTPKCMWCGKTYDEHESSRSASSPKPKTPCLILKSGFSPQKCTHGFVRGLCGICHNPINTHPELFASPPASLAQEDWIREFHDTFSKGKHSNICLAWSDDDVPLVFGSSVESIQEPLIVWITDHKKLWQDEAREECESELNRVAGALERIRFQMHNGKDCYSDVVKLIFSLSPETTKGDE